MKLHNKYFIALKKCQTILSKVETIASLPASLKRAKQAQKLLDNSLRELNNLIRINDLYQLDIASFLSDIEQKIVFFYGKTQDLYTEAYIDDLVTSSMSLKTKKETELHNKKLCDLLKNNRLSTSQLQRLKTCQKLGSDNSNRTASTELTIEETETLLESAFMLFKGKISLAKESIAKIPPESKELLEEEMKQLNIKDLFSNPKNGSLALFRVFYKRQGILTNKKVGRIELNAFIKERKSLDEQEIKTSKIIAFKAVI